MTELTFKGELLAKHCDEFGYITYVFSNEDSKSIDDKYILCVQFPNWNQEVIKQGDVGFYSVRYVQAGIDKWYDGNGFTPYKYTNIIFQKFIRIKECIDTEIQLD